MQRLNNLLQVAGFNHTRYLDLGGADHLDAHAFIRDDLEHLGGNPRVANHPGADNRYLDQTVLGSHFTVRQYAVQPLDDFFGLLKIAKRYSEGEICRLVLYSALHDNVNIHALIGQLAEYLGEYPGTSGTPRILIRATFLS